MARDKDTVVSDPAFDSVLTALAPAAVDPALAKQRDDIVKQIDDLRVQLKALDDQINTPDELKKAQALKAVQAIMSGNVPPGMLHRLGR